MKAKDLRQLSEDELSARVRELRNEVFNGRVKHATAQLDDTASLRRSRRDLARALTIQTERRKQP
jgi:large subunit ribosomal protein L29